MGACDPDGIGSAFAGIIKGALYRFAVHVNFPAGTSGGIAGALPGAFPEAGTAGSGWLRGISSFHHDIAFTAIVIFVVHTGLC